MRLTIIERIELLKILPKEGDFVTLKLVRDLQNDLSFTEEEIKESKMKLSAGVYAWEKNVMKELEFGEATEAILEDVLKKADKIKQLNINLLNVYNLIVNKPGEKS